MGMRLPTHQVMHSCFFQPNVHSTVLFVFYADKPVTFMLRAYQEVMNVYVDTVRRPSSVYGRVPGMATAVVISAQRRVVRLRVGMIMTFQGDGELRRVMSPSLTLADHRKRYARDASAPDVAGFSVTRVFCGIYTLNHICRAPFSAIWQVTIQLFSAASRVKPTARSF